MHNNHWLNALRVYVAVSAAAHFIWEVLQLPLYTIWTLGTPREIAFAVIHCTAGDVMVATLTLIAALTIAGSRDWPSQKFLHVAAITVGLGLSFTICSEWLNVVIRKSWAYSRLMPTLPGTGTGLSPLVQWIVIPLTALFLAKPRSL